MARNLFVDHVRRKGVRGKHDEGPTDEADAAPAEERSPESRRDAERQLEFVRREVEAGRVEPHVLEAMEAAASGEPQKELADKLGVSHQSFRNRVARTRARLRARWAAYIAAGAVVVVLLFLVLRPRPPEPVPSAENERRAAEMRKDALRYCHDKAWRACLEWLDEARALDPKGDDAPEIVAARASATEGLRPAPEDLRNLPATGRDR
jgi:hypothetical protein